MCKLSLTIAGDLHELLGSSLYTETNVNQSINSELLHSDDPLLNRSVFDKNLVPINAETFKLNSALGIGYDHHVRKSFYIKLFIYISNYFSPSVLHFIPN